MIVMALDHVRDFIHRGAMSQSPTDLATTTPCAVPDAMGDALLRAGIHAHGRHRRLLSIWQESGEADAKAQLSRFLVTRGLWLMFLEVTVMQLAYNFDVSSSYPIFLLVLWGLGACMIVLAALVWLPITLLTVLSVATIVLHHLLDGVRAQSFGSLGADLDAAAPGRRVSVRRPRLDRAVHR